MKLYIVGKVNYENYKEWEFCGIFNSKEEAEKHCLNCFYFVGPCELNKFVEGTYDWPDAYYPKEDDWKNV